MSNALVTAFKVACISGWCSLSVWIGYYSRHARWWKNPIGRSLVYHAALVGGLLLVSTLSLFLHFNRLTSAVAGWADVALVGLVTPVMLGRTWIFRREVKRRRQAPHCPTCGCGVR